MIRESEPAEEGAVLIRFGNPPPLHDFCSELSCKTLEGLDGLRQLIFHVTCNMKDVGSSICSQKLAGRLVRTVLSSSEPSQRWASRGLVWDWEVNLWSYCCHKRCVKYTELLWKKPLLQDPCKG